MPAFAPVDSPDEGVCVGEATADVLVPVELVVEGMDMDIVIVVAGGGAEAAGGVVAL